MASPAKEQDARPAQPEEPQSDTATANGHAHEEAGGSGSAAVSAASDEPSTSANKQQQQQNGHAHGVDQGQEGKSGDKRPPTSDMEAVAPPRKKLVESAHEQAQDVDMDADGTAAAGPYFKPSEQVDAFCSDSETWRPAAIEEVTEESFFVRFEDAQEPASTKISKQDQAVRLARKTVKAADAWAALEQKPKKAKKQEAPAPEAPVFVELGVSRLGRRITKRVVNDVPARKPAPKSAKKAATKAKTEMEDVPNMAEDILCGSCGEIEDDSLSDMILCDGGCLSSYHLSCLGLEEAPEVEKWLCEQCRTNEQKCFACDRNATIGEKGGVFRCSDAHCGKFYHQSCINAHKHSRRFGKAKTMATDEIEEDDSLSWKSAFRCPRHICSVCEDQRKGADLMFCLKCPESYHPGCVPPSARYNSVGLLCSKHSYDQLPKIPAFYLADRSFDLVTVDFNLHLPMLYLPDTEPDENEKDDCHHFRMLLNLMEDVRQQPPPFRTLLRSIYTFKPPKVSLEDSPMCICKASCGDDCINRLSFTECFGPAPDDVNVSKQNRDFNCLLGENCGNRALHQKTYPRFERFHSPDKGFGLRVLEPVKAGQLVIEYVGEVILEEEKERRLLDHAKNTPDDKNMYIMELSKGVYIDARFKGSVSRFINHSCDPNCHLLKWRVKGVNRIAITALKDIKPGEELSYDYQFHTKQAMEWKCHCKSKKCRGTMAPDKINQHTPDTPEKKLTKKEQQKKMKRALAQEKLNQEKEEKATARRLTLTAQVSIGDLNVVNKSVVRMGPAQRELFWARHNRVFLARNALRGFDFLKRKQLRDARTKSNSRHKRETNGLSVKAEPSGDVEMESTAPTTTD